MEIINFLIFLKLITTNIIYNEPQYIPANT